MQFDSEDPRTRRRRRKLRPLQLAPTDIGDWLLEREPTAIGSYLDLAPEEYARAFTAAQTIGTDIAQDLWEAMIGAVAQGGALVDFQSLVMPTLRAKGWLEGNEGQIASRVKLIYDTNMRLARSAGRWAGYQKSRDLFPYLRAFTVGDERVRHPPKSPKSDHRAWDDIILPVDHWFWRLYWPPLGFRCRCEVVQMSRSELARFKGGVTSEADLADRIERLGPPVFAAPAMPIAAQLDSMVENSNAPKPSKGGWTVDGLSGLTADEANRAIEARKAAEAPRMPGLPPVNPRETAREGGDIWDAVLRAKSREDIGRQLAKIGL
jgi:hypothetical protein